MQKLLKFSLILASFATALPAFAKDSQKKHPNTPNKEKKVLVLDESVVKGKIQKPEAFYILQNTDLKYEELDETQPFVKQIVQVLMTDPVSQIKN